MLEKFGMLELKLKECKIKLGDNFFPRIRKKIEQVFAAPVIKEIAVQFDHLL